MEFTDFAQKSGVINRRMIKEFHIGLKTAIVVKSKLIIKI